jgi:hypothetical protein
MRVCLHLLEIWQNILQLLCGSFPLNLPRFQSVWIFAITVSSKQILPKIWTFAIFGQEFILNSFLPWPIAWFSCVDCFDTNAIGYEVLTTLESAERIALTLTYRESCEPSRLTVLRKLRSMNWGTKFRIKSQLERTTNPAACVTYLSL